MGFSSATLWWIESLQNTQSPSRGQPQCPEIQSSPTWEQITVSELPPLPASPAPLQCQLSKPTSFRGFCSMGAMFSPGILGEWEGIWIQNFLWTVSYLSPLGIFFPSLLPTFLCSFLRPSLSPFLSFSFLKIKKKNYFLAVLWGLLDLSSQSRDWTKAMAVKAPGPNHLITREFPKKFKKSLDVKDMNYLFWQMSCLCYLWLFQQ